jgi:hypothetical protein
VVKSYVRAKRPQRKSEQSIRVTVLTAYIATCALMVFAVVGSFTEIKGYGLGGQWPDVSIGVMALIAAWCTSTLVALTWWVRRVA